MKLFARFAKDESGATAIEYGLIAALIGVAIIVIGLALRLNALLVVLVAGFSSGLVAGMSPTEILAALGQDLAHAHGHVAEVDVDRAGRLALVADGAVVGDVVHLIEVLE